VIHARNWDTTTTAGVHISAPPGESLVVFLPEAVNQNSALAQFSPRDALVPGPVRRDTFHICPWSEGGGTGEIAKRIPCFIRANTAPCPARGARCVPTELHDPSLLRRPLRVNTPL